jgi:hypothetical protein
VLWNVDGPEYVDWERLVPDEAELWVETAVGVVSVDVAVEVDELRDTVQVQLVRIE